MTITDEFINDYFYGKSSFIKRNNIKPYNEEIKNYLENRFNDSKSIFETIFRIKNNIEVRPKCAYCGGDVLFVGKKSKPYQKYCCRSCLSKGNVEKIKDKYGTTCTLTLDSVKEKTIDTLQKHYGEGVTHNWKAKEVHAKCVETTNQRHTREEINERVRKTKLDRYGNERYVNVEKVKQTKLEKYGDENYTNKEKAKQTCLEKYGVEYAIADEGVREKIKQSYIEHYGVDHPLKVESIKNKIKQTCIQKYGVDNPFKSQAIIEEIKQKWIERYGVDHPLKAKIIRDRIKQTCIEKYGVDNPLKSKEIQNRVKQTLLRNYGVDHPFKSVDIQNKSKQTLLKNYGVDNPLKSEEIQNRVKQTNLYKYGVEYVSQSEEIKNKIKQTYLEHYGVDHPFKSKIIRNKIKQTCLEKYGVDHPSKSEIIREKVYNTLKKNNTFNSSSIEKEFKQYLIDHNINFKYQYKSEQYPFNCDFYLIDYDLYIEIQGTWTHGRHPFDNKSIDDINKVNEWKLKNTDYYNGAIHTWTISDVRKRNIAKQNNLNYIEVFSTKLNDVIDEINLFLNNKYL